MYTELLRYFIQKLHYVCVCGHMSKLQKAQFSQIEINK